MTTSLIPKRRTAISGTIKDRTKIMHAAVSGGGAPTYLFDRRALVRWELMGLVYVARQFSDFDVYRATESGRLAFEGWGMAASLIRKKTKKESPPPKKRYVTSLSLRQAEWLRRASEKPGGCFAPVMSGPEPTELVEGGLAEYREVCVPTEIDGKLCQYTDFFLVPTKAGLDMLRAYDQKSAKDLDNYRKRWARPAGPTGGTRT